MISQITGADMDTALKTLEQADRKVAGAIVMLTAGCTKEEAAEALERTDGRVRQAIAQAGKQ